MFLALSRRLIARGIWPLLLCAATFPVAAGSAFAQHTEVQDIASHFAVDIANAGKKRVIVADFVGPQEKLTQLGKYLALEFTASLAWTGRGLEASHTIGLERALSDQALTPKDQSDPKVVRRLGEQTRAEVVVLGNLVSAADAVTLRVRALDASDGRLVAEAVGKIPKSPAVEALLAEALPRPVTPSPGASPTSGPKFAGSPYMAGVGGIGQPSCVACPSPQYSDQARREKITGTVLLHLIVTPEGRAANIQVQRSLGYGLDEMAVEAVRNWQFKPAVDPEGKPVPVWANIEVTFRLK
jgi:TonB family protein